jgi:polysaccharide biosynthesis/export protein VpsN
MNPYSEEIALFFLLQGFHMLEVMRLKWFVFSCFFLISALFSSVAVGEDVDGSFLVHAGDKLNVQVYGDKDLSGVFSVDESGKINYPLLGPVEVQNLELSEVQQVLSERLGKDYLVDPRVQVDFEKSTAKSLIILGQINKPATYDYVPGMTLLRLISDAGGFTSLSDPGRVKIVRSVKNGAKETIKVNVKRILDGKQEDFELQPGDVIVVAESFF